MKRALSILLQTSLVVGWVYMSYRLFEEEVLPQLQQAEAKGFDLILDLPLGTNHYGLFDRGKRVGDASIAVEEEPGGGRVIRSHFLGGIDLLFRNRTVQLNSRTTVDPKGDPTAFDLRVEFGTDPKKLKPLFSLRGKLDQDRLPVELKWGALQYKAFELEKEMVFSSSVGSMPMPAGLKVGDKWPMQFLDLRRVTKSRVTAEVVDERQVEVGGRTIRAVTVHILKSSHADVPPTLVATVLDDGRLYDLKTEDGFEVRMEERSR